MGQKNNELALVTLMTGIMMMTVIKESQVFRPPGSDMCACATDHPPAPPPMKEAKSPLPPRPKNIAKQANILSVKRSLTDKGYILIPGPIMKTLLKKYGAREEELKALESGSIHQHLPPDQQPVMAHRPNSCHRVLFNMTSGEISTADTHAVTQYPKREIASDFRDGAKIAYRRYGTRYCNLPPHVYVRSSVSRAMARINMILTPEVHQPQDNINIDNEITIDDQILIRTSRFPAQGSHVSPTPEGRHQDNTEISSVTMIGRYNVTGGGETRLWDITAPTGNYDEEEFSRGEMDDKLILDHSLTEPWETVYFNDRKLKHEARAVTGDGPGPWVRDVIVNFIRKPVKDGTDVMLRRESFVSL